jgi:serine/threonine protein kinase/Flp pilus assembly protein TadD
MGDVYQAYDTRLRRTVALKVLRGDSPLEEHESSRLRREARALAAMVHPRICGVHDVGQSDGVEFIVMELLEGRTLAATLSSGFRFTRDGLLTAAEELADGLSVAHERGIVHRDLKPGNIMVTSHGLKIMDFGLAKFLASRVATGSDPAASASESSRGTRRGTLQYMAPEAIDGHDLDERADVFALGAVLHEMATGVPVFAADTASAMIVAIMTREARSLVEIRPDVPTSLAEVVSRCLNKAPSARYKSAVEVHEALSRIRTVRKGGPVAGRTVNESKSGHGHAAGRSKRGLAVLPFLDLSEGSRQDYLADGISEAVITHLGETGRMHVIGWTSASALRGSGLSAAEIGRTLNVDTLVEGSVRALGDAIAVAVRVIEAHSGLQKWSTTLTQPRADLAELQAAVARAIAQQLASVVPGRRQVRAIDPEAHDAYLRGIFLLNNQPDEWEAACRSELERAIALSPRYAAAHAALSRWYNLSGRLTPTDGVTDHAALAQAEYWARQAVEADPRLADGHSALARVHFFRLRIPEALASWGRATELDATCANAWAGLALCYASMVRAEDAVSCVERAVEIEPLSTSIRNNAATVLYVVRNYARCIEACDAGLALAPRLWVLHAHKGLSYLYLRDFERAERSLRYSLECRPGHPHIRAALGILECQRGDVSAATRILGELRAEGAEAFSIAWLSSALGDDEIVLTLLEGLFKERSPYLLTMKSEPVFDRLRAHPRWQRLVRALNLDGDAGLAHGGH